MAIAEKLEVHFGPPLSQIHTLDNVDLENTDGLLDFILDINGVAEAESRTLGESAFNDEPDASAVDDIAHSQELVLDALCRSWDTNEGEDDRLNTQLIRDILFGLLIYCGARFDQDKMGYANVDRAAKKLDGYVKRAVKDLEPDRPL